MTRPLSLADRAALAVALALFARVGHEVEKSGPTNESCRQRDEALRVARRLGVGREFAETLIRLPVCRVALLEAPDAPPAPPRRKYRKRGAARPRRAKLQET